MNALALTVPQDPAAEEAVTAAAVSNGRTAKGLSLVSADDFYDQRLARVFALREELGRYRFLDERVAAAAELAEVDAAYVRRLVSRQPVMFGLEPYARRVLDAARRRRLMCAAAETFNELGAGASLDDALPRLREAVA